MAKLTPRERAYRREYTRISRFIKAASKRGFVFTADALPEIPENITSASVRKLQAITPQQLYQRALYQDPQTGNIMPGTEGRALERSRASAKAARTVRQARQVTPGRARTAPVEETYRKEWQKEAKRVRALIRAVENRGYAVETDVIPKRPQIITAEDVAKLKGITGQTIYERATYTDPETGEMYTGVQGRFIERSRAAKKGAANRIPSAREGFYEDSELEQGTDREQAPSKTQKVLDNVAEQLLKQDINYIDFDAIKDEIDNWTPNPAWNSWWERIKEGHKLTAANIFYGAISEYGADVVAKRLEKSAVDVVALIENILYGSGGTKGKGYDPANDQIRNDLLTFSAIVKGSALSQEESETLSEQVESLMYETDLEDE